MLSSTLTGRSRAQAAGLCPPAWDLITLLSEWITKIVIVHQMIQPLKNPLNKIWFWPPNSEVSYASWNSIYVKPLQKKKNKVRSGKLGKKV